MRRALIFAGGSLDVSGAQMELLKGPWDSIICADSGARHARALGLTPHLLVGDLDSMAPSDREWFAQVPVLRFPSDKDQTDTHLAVDLALEKGATYIVIAGGLGGRLDHTLANAHLLSVIDEAIKAKGYDHGAADGIKGVVTDGRQSVYLLTHRLTLTLRGRPDEVLSIVPLCDVLEGLTLEGVRWELRDKYVRFGQTLTISNEFTQDEARLSVRKGKALVIVGEAT